MEVFNTVSEFRSARRRLTGSLGLIPTMGYLHHGHMELVRQANAENDTVVASIFVNPTQFGPNEDLASYPRDLDRDLSMLELQGTSLVFNPKPIEMYPLGYATYIDAGPVSQPMEGVHRPSHFRGVATVVAKLFNIVQPDRAYFGQKDAQQVAVIKRMAADLDVPVDIVVVPTVREADGLAMSSRNVYLDPPGRTAARCLSKALLEVERLWDLGERHSEVLRRRMNEVVLEEPLAYVEYATVADAFTMKEFVEAIDRTAIAALAVRIGKTRLIDNVLLDPTGDRL